MSLGFPEDVGIAIVCHNNREKLTATIESLDAAGCARTKLLIVDVASTDGTPEWLRDVYPTVNMRVLDRNDGPNPGRNLGIRETPQPYVFLMDADVQVLPDTIPRLRAAMEEDRAIKIGSPIVVHAGDPCTIQYAGGRLHFICEAINPWVDRPLAARGTAPADVGVASANGLLIDRAAAVDVGLFDERYFMGKDDGDFTHRMRIAGHRIREVPEALVLHQSRPRGDWLFYYQIRNRWHFMLKNYQWRTLLAILPCLAVHEPLQLLVLHASGHGGTYWKAVRGVIAMLPDLGRDRALTARIRAVSDGSLLGSDRLIVRDDLLKNPLVRFGKGTYERLLTAYWGLLRHTVLAG
jgi:GT2 family glycosyltransferase